MQGPNKSMNVYISCSESSADKPLREQLEHHLSTLQRAGLITIWHRGKILPGQVWQRERDRHLDAASLILLLLSSDYLDSDDCCEYEMPRALQRRNTGKSRVIPILLRPCDWQHTPLVDLKPLPSTATPITTSSNRDTAWTDVVEGIRQALESISGGPQTDTSSISMNVNLQHSMQKFGAFPMSASSEQEHNPMQKLKVLFLAANPVNTDRQALDEEMREIDQKVRESDLRDNIELQSSWAVRPGDLLQLLNRHRPQVVHFSGHGSHEGLCLVGNDGQVRLATARALEALFTTLKDNIRLIFLNACYSRDQATALVKTIDCVVGMKDSIGDDAAITFASYFYSAIGYGRSVQKAFDQGIAALMLENIPEEDIPELLVKDGCDPAQIVLVEPQANPR